MSPRNCPDQPCGHSQGDHGQGDHGHDDHGQATVEFALTLPILIVVLLGAVQVFVVSIDRLHLVHVTRDATRAAAVSGDSFTAADRVVDRAWPDRPVSVEVTDTGRLVTVRVTLTNSTDVPIIGRFLPDVRLTESLSMYAETFTDSDPAG